MALFFLALLLHAWIGVRDVVIDYVHNFSARLTVLTCGSTAAGMALFWWLYGTAGGWVPFVFYLWVTIVIALNLSQIWALAAQLFDPRQARRLFAFLGVSVAIYPATVLLLFALAMNIPHWGGKLIAAVLMLLMMVLPSRSTASGSQPGRSPST